MHMCQYLLLYELISFGASWTLMNIYRCGLALLNSIRSFQSPYSLPAFTTALFAAWYPPPLYQATGANDEEIFSVFEFSCQWYC